MKFYKNLLLLCFSLMFFACENSILKWDLPQLASVETSDPVKLSNSAVKCSGIISNDGGSFVKERGICYSTEPNPTISGNKVASGSGKGTFTAVIEGLSQNTVYYFRAYATTKTGVSYGNETVLGNGVLPQLRTNSATSITTTTAVCGGSIVNTGSSDIIEQGICYSTSSGPTISDTKISSPIGTTDFSINLNGLTQGTTYFVRAYAVNITGISYGNEISFITASVSIPTVSTIAVTSVTLNSAVSGGNVTSDGGNPVSERGICYSTVSNPTISDNKITSGSGTGIFNITITGLNSGITYHLRAYAKNSAGISYGNEITFSTASPLLPTVSTATVSSITNNSAVSGGNVTADGGSPVTERGICFSTTANPTTSNTKIISGSGNGSFTANITGLIQGTTYHVRAYATNSAGTSYGNDISFATSSPSLPTITTTAASSITFNSAVSGGNVTADGGSPVIERGVCFSTTANPTVSNTKIQSGSGNGNFTSNIIGLAQSTTYHVRAYATNSVGTSYGNDISFATSSPSLPTITTAAASSITTNSAVSGGNVTGDGGSPVTERGVCFSTTANPTISNTKIQSGSGNGSFIANITGLVRGTTYHVRAYATNSAGIAYGDDISFTTTSPALATLTTTAASFITTSSAVSGGNVTADGGSAVTERGICYSTSTNPTTSDTKIQSGAGIGNFSINLTALKNGTIYYIRAYAVNSEGIAYGNQVNFTTKSILPATITTSSATSITNTTAVTGGNVSDDGGGSISERGICFRTTPGPDISDNKIISGAGTGIFTVSLSGLSLGTTYYVRAYAVNASGVSYGNEINFTTTSVLAIGVIYQEGIIFYLDNTGKHGLIAAPSDQSSEAKWGCSGTSIDGSTGTTIGTGLKNTMSVVSNCNDASAARICYNLNLGSYTDWYLPSKDELNLMYENLKTKGIGNFSAADYWSSSQESDKNSWLQSFSTGRSSSKNKNTSMYVRAVRSF